MTKVKGENIYSGSIKIADIKKPRYLISFGDNHGKLVIQNDKLHFEGKADKSAKLFFDAFKGLVDEYIKKEKEK